MLLHADNHRPPRYANDDPVWLASRRVCAQVPIQARPAFWFHDVALSLDPPTDDLAGLKSNDRQTDGSIGAVLSSSAVMGTL